MTSRPGTRKASRKTASSIARPSASKDGAIISRGQAPLQTYSEMSRRTESRRLRIFVVEVWKSTAQKSDLSKIVRQVAQACNDGVISRSLLMSRMAVTALGGLLQGFDSAIL